jgi:ribonuclease BN (tRNA processing enzyme)
MKNSHFTFAGMVIQPIQTVHIMDGYTIQPSFGLMINDKIFITTDTQFCPHQIMDFYKKAEVIFHDCEYGYKSGVHANLDDLATLPKEIKQKMWLCHYPDTLLDMHTYVCDLGFAGLVEKGQRFEF